MTQLQMILFLCPIFFFTSFVDAVSGGGGLVALPAYLFTGMPVHSAYACNKVGCVVGSFTSFIRFWKKWADRYENGSFCGSGHLRLLHLRSADCAAPAGPAS